CFFFFFQAEDGIRDRTVTGVQTCALPILSAVRAGEGLTRVQTDAQANLLFAQALIAAQQFPRAATVLERFTTGADASPSALYLRSEERRVGKECISRWSPKY